jgi:hypothetical protein
MDVVSARRKPGEGAVFAFEPRPGCVDVALLCSPEEYAAVVRRGWASLDGIRGAVVAESCDPAAGLVRIRLERPWRPESYLEAVAA